MSTTDERLRNMFYEEEPDLSKLSDITKMMTPKVHAPHLYKKLAQAGYVKGWIKDPAKYPLMYPLLYNAGDTAQAVEYRFRSMTNNEDDSFVIGLGWCTYTAMADAYLCNEDWDSLAKEGLVYKLERLCGFENIDDYVERVFHISDENALRKHITEMVALAKEPYENDHNPSRVLQKNECLTAMYYYGIELAMQYLNLL